MLTCHAAFTSADCEHRLSIALWATFCPVDRFHVLLLFCVAITCKVGTRLVVTAGNKLELRALTRSMFACVPTLEAVSRSLMIFSLNSNWCDNGNPCVRKGVVYMDTVPAYLAWYFLKIRSHADECDYFIKRFRYIEMGELIVEKQMILMSSTRLS